MITNFNPYPRCLKAMSRFPFQSKMTMSWFPISILIQGFWTMQKTRKCHISISIQNGNVMNSNFNLYPGFLNLATKWQCHDFYVNPKCNVMISNFNLYPEFLTMQQKSNVMISNLNPYPGFWIMQQNESICHDF